MPFSDELREAAAEIWDAARILRDRHRRKHLPPDRFRFYVRRDYLFLIDYGRLLALGCARTPRLELMDAVHREPGW